MAVFEPDTLAVTSRFLAQLFQEKGNSVLAAVLHELDGPLNLKRSDDFSPSAWRLVKSVAWTLCPPTANCSAEFC